MAWTQVAPQYGSITQVNSVAVLSGEIYGAANNGSLLKWNGTNAWTEVAAPLGSYVIAKQLTECNGVLYAILCTAGSFTGKLHHFTGSAWSDTSPATPTTGVSFLAPYNNRLFALTATLAATGSVVEYVGTATYTTKANTVPAAPTSFSAEGNWFVIGLGDGTIRQRSNVDGGTSLTTATGLTGTVAITSIATDGTAWYLGSANGRLQKDTSGASGAYSTLVAPLATPAAVTALRIVGGEIYAGLSTP